MQKISILHLNGCSYPVERQSKGASGFDLRAAEKTYLPAGLGNYRIVKTGICMEIPAGIEGQIRPRSGLAANHGITVLNSPGTIDSDYRGEICVIMQNFGARDYIIEPGERIAQIIFSRVVDVEIETVKKIEKTERNTAGFGSTGRI